MLWLLLIVLIALFIVFPIIGLAISTIISSIIVGLVIGALGRLVIPGRQPIGLLATVMLGLIGSIVGGFIGRHAFHIGSLSILLEIGIAAAALYAARPGQKSSLRSSGGSTDSIDRWR